MCSRSLRPGWPSNRILYTGNGKIRTVSLQSGEAEDVPFEAEFTLHRPAYQRKQFDLDSSAARPVEGIVSPALSPDGKHIVFEALNQLWIMDIGGKPQALTHDRYYKEDPAWSPDGKRIAYSSDKAGTEDIYVLDLATKSEQRVTTSADSAEVASAWSPDGKMLAYQNEHGATFVLDLESGKSRQVVGPLFAPSKPSWSADGKTLAIGALKAYTHRFREGTSQILTADVATGALTYHRTGALPIAEHARRRRSALLAGRLFGGIRHGERALDPARGEERRTRRRRRGRSTTK